MNRVALTGPAYSGKTAIAERLFWENDYFLLNFTDILKRKASIALNAIGIPVSPETIKRRKDTYRGLLQELAVLTDFNDHPEYFIEEACADWWHQYVEYPAVFDNVRTEAQAEILTEKYGFQIVRLDIDLNEQAKRAAEHGVSFEQLMRHKDHFIEQGIPEEYVSLHIDVTTVSVEEVCSILTVGNSRVQETSY